MTAPLFVGGVGLVSKPNYPQVYPQVGVRTVPEKVHFWLKTEERVSVVRAAALVAAGI